MVDCGVMSLARGDGDGGRRGVKGERGESLFMKQNIKKYSFLWPNLENYIYREEVGRDIGTTTHEVHKSNLAIISPSLFIALYIPLLFPKSLSHYLCLLLSLSLSISQSLDISFFFFHDTSPTIRVSNKKKRIIPIFLPSVAFSAQDFTLHSWSRLYPYLLLSLVEAAS